MSAHSLFHGITTLDTGYLRPGFDASHLLVEGEQAAFIDTGTVFAVPRLLNALRERGIARERVTHVMVTHVHLDHAGGAGALLRELPEAKLIAHPRGARHMIDPSKLIAGAAEVYGGMEKFREIYGEIAPVPAARVIEAHDGFTLDFNGRELLFIDTPGHARHHYCVYDARSGGVFAGDAFGLSYREFDTARGAFIFPSTSPVQFEPEAMHDSIDRLLALRPARLYLTHYGCVEDAPRLGVDLHRFIDAFTGLAESCVSRDDRRAALEEGMREILLAALVAHGCALPRERALELLACDIDLNARGIELWLERERQ